MILLETKKTVLSMAVMLKDALSSDQRTRGDVYLTASGVRKAPIRHLSTGYFLFIDLPKGVYTITAGGKFYREEEFAVDTGPLNPKQPLVDLFLEPKDNYPFPEGMIMLRGRVVGAGDNEPISGVSIKVRNLPKRAISDEKGAFFIYLESIDREDDSPITLYVKKEGYRNRWKRVLPQKGINPVFTEIKLIQK